MTVKNTLLLLIAGCCSCSDNQTHMPKEKMEAVLLDVMVAEQSVLPPPGGRVVGTAKNPDSLAVYYTSIFKKHGISRSSFERDLKWYSSNQKEMDSLLAHVIANADRLLRDSDTVWFK